MIRRECVGPDEISVLTIISEPKANHPKWPSVIFKVVNSRIDNPKEETDILESIQELFIACGGEPQLVILLNFVAPVTVASVRDTLKFEREHGTKEQALARQPQCYLEIWGHRGLKEECDLYLHTPRMVTLSNKALFIPDREC